MSVVPGSCPGANSPRHQLTRSLPASGALPSPVRWTSTSVDNPPLNPPLTKRQSHLLKERRPKPLKDWGSRSRPSAVNGYNFSLGRVASSALTTFFFNDFPLAAFLFVDFFDGLLGIRSNQLLMVNSPEFKQQFGLLVQSSPYAVEYRSHMFAHAGPVWTITIQ